MSKFSVVVAVYALVCTVAAFFLLFGNYLVAGALLLLAQVLLAALVGVIHKFLVFDSSRTRAMLKDESRENRKIIKEVRNSEKRYASRLEKKIDKLDEQIAGTRKLLDKERKDLASGSRSGSEAIAASDALSSKSETKVSKRLTVWPKIGKLSDFVQAVGRNAHSLFSDFQRRLKGSANSIAPSKNFPAPSPEEQQTSATVKSAEVIAKPTKAAPSVRPEKMMAELLCGAFTKTREQVLKNTTLRDAEEVKPKVLFVSSNGAGLGHLTRLSAVDKKLDSRSLFYTMSSAYKMIGKSSAEAIYFPSHGDLGMTGKLWNPLMEEHFDSVVSGFEPDAIVFDGTYVYRGVISVSKKRQIPLVWMQRGCWKPDVDAKSKQRHSADKFASLLMVPGDYGCEEKVDVGKSLEPVYLPPVTLVTREELLSRKDARSLLSLPMDKKLFLVQLGAGNINDITDIRKTAIEAVNRLGDEWLPVLVRNPLSKGVEDSEALSIQAYPLSIYYNAFDAGAFAAGYNTVQEAVEMGLPSVFVPNLETKTDDQLRRATEIEERGLGLSAVGLTELKDSIKELGDSSARERIKVRQAEFRAPSGAESAARAITYFLSKSKP